jgi:hypothetical protein
MDEEVSALGCGVKRGVLTGLTLVHVIIGGVNIIIVFSIILAGGKAGCGWLVGWAGGQLEVRSPP